MSELKSFEIAFIVHLLDLALEVITKFLNISMFTNGHLNELINIQLPCSDSRVLKQPIIGPQKVTGYDNSRFPRYRLVNWNNGKGSLKGITLLESDQDSSFKLCQKLSNCLSGDIA